MKHVLTALSSKYDERNKGDSFYEWQNQTRLNENIWEIKMSSISYKIHGRGPQFWVCIKKGFLESECGQFAWLLWVWKLGQKCKILAQYLKHKSARPTKTVVWCVNTIVFCVSWYMWIIFILMALNVTIPTLQTASGFITSSRTCQDWWSTWSLDLMNKHRE